MKKRFSLSMKLTIIILVFAFLLSSSAIIISYRTYADKIDHYYMQTAAGLAATGASFMNGDKMEYYLETRDLDDEYYQMLDVLFQIRENNDITYLYLQHVNAETGICTYVMDADNSETGCVIGDTETIQDANRPYMHHLEGGIPPFISHLPEYGWLVSCGAPIFDSNGNVTTLCFVDLSMDEVMQDRYNYLIVVCTILITMTIVLLFMILFALRKAVVKPINDLAKAASSFLDDREENKNEICVDSAISKLQIHSGDEVEALCTSIKEMEQDINTYIINLTNATAEKERISAELNVATQIQESMLPCIFPPFPDCSDFDIYASMRPAKEVGGDLYDFFLIDDNHLCVVIADVSGKGVPAALFMVIAKTLIKNHTQIGKSPEEVFTIVNQQLCENNGTGLFVTAWMGVLEISTGLFTYVNAGHNPPLVSKNGEPFEFVRQSPGSVLAGLEGMKYKQQEMQLNTGDLLYIYTDGVTEAVNAVGDYYGNDRLREVLNSHREASVDTIVHSVANNVDVFAGECDQFDDITMLCLKIN